jgi:hypothetical protein
MARCTPGTALFVNFPILTHISYSMTSGVPPVSPQWFTKSFVHEQARPFRRRRGLAERDASQRPDATCAKCARTAAQRTHRCKERILAAMTMLSALRSAERMGARTVCVPRVLSLVCSALRSSSSARSRCGGENGLAQLWGTQPAAQPGYFVRTSTRVATSCVLLLNVPRHVARLPTITSSMEPPGLFWIVNFVSAL